jgi:predicted ABC-type sugar transport system permease subunit
MKWVVGGLLLAVLASVVSGRVPVIWVVYCFAALFASLGGALFFAYSRSKHHGLLLLGATYFAAALAAVVLGEWWPLVAGFGLVWVMRMMGVEPPAEPLPGETTAAGAEGEKKG